MEVNADSFKQYTNGNFSIKVLCPHCRKIHKHGTTDLSSIGHRGADCGKGEYYIRPIVDVNMGNARPNQFKKVLS
jgi:hypothetical protein